MNMVNLILNKHTCGILLVLIYMGIKQPTREGGPSFPHTRHGLKLGVSENGE